MRGFRFLFSSLFVFMSFLTLSFGAGAQDPRRNTPSASRYRTAQLLSMDLQDVLNVIDTIYYKKIDLRDCYLKIQYGGLSNCLDPYSSYVTVEEWLERSLSSVDTMYSGSGIRIIYMPDGGFYSVIPMSESISAESGIKGGDILLTVNGKSVTGLDRDSVSEISTKDPNLLTVTVSRNGKTIGPLRLTRKMMRKTDVVFEKIDSTLAHIYLLGFNERSYEDLKRALVRVRKETKSGSFILDLRYNPGGEIPATINTIHLFARDSSRLVLTAKNENVGWTGVDSTSEVGEFSDLSFVILTKRRTASAAELFSGVMKYWKRAPVVGDTTHGKGLAQRYVALPSGNFVYLSVHEIFVGDNADIKIQGIGVPPDYLIVNKPFSPGNVFYDDEFDTAVKLIRKIIH